MVVGGAAVMAGDASIHGGQAGTHASGEFVLFHFRHPLLFLSSSFAPREKFTSPAIRHFDPHTQGSESGLLFLIFFLCIYL